MGRIEEVRIVMDADPFVEPEECPECGSDLLAVECSGPLTNWIECGECGVWIPQAQ